MLQKYIPKSTVEQFEIFDIDNAAVGGRRAVSLLNQRLALENTTDLVLDCSALSIGVFFPLAKYCAERAAASSPPLNLHLIVLDDPTVDAAVEESPCGKASALHAFQGRLNTEAVTAAVRLWLPQLGPASARC